MANTQISITANGTKTLKTAGKYCDRDIEVNVNVPSESTGITPTGTKTITTNGTHDVTSYASANVNVPVPNGYIKPSGSLFVNANGTYDVTEKANVVVDVPSSAPAPTQFTNILTHASTEIKLNATHKGAARNGAFAVIMDMVALGITATKSITIRTRGLWLDLSYAGAYGSADKSTWSTRKNFDGCTRDEYGDIVWTVTCNPTAYPYFALVFRQNASAITESAYAGAILTIDQPIGNGGYVG